MRVGTYSDASFCGQWDYTGQFMILFKEEGSLSIWDVRTQASCDAFACGSEPIVTWSSVCHTIYVSDVDDTTSFIIFYKYNKDAASSTKVSKLYEATLPFATCGATWSPCGKFIALSHDPNKITLWMTQTRTTGRSFDTHRFQYRTCFSPHSRYLVTCEHVWAGSEETSITKFTTTSVATGEVVATQEMPNARRVFLHPDMTFVVLTGLEGLDVFSK